jgi:hypothetical protein
MLLVYTTMLLVLGAVSYIIGRKVAALERKHVQVARAADRLARAPTFLEGSSSRPDSFQSARKMFALGQLAQKQDRLESNYAAWQGAHERFARLVSGLRGFKGKTIPYTFGVIDVIGVLTLIDYLGFSEVVSPRKLVELISTLVSGG